VTDSVRAHRWGTAAKLTAFLGLILACVLGLALTALLYAFSSQSDATTTRALVAQVRAYAIAAGQRPARESLATFTDSYLQARVLPDGQLLLISLPDGSLIGSAGSDPVLRSTAFTRWLDTAATKQKAHLNVGGRHYLTVGVPFTAPGSARPGTVVATADLAQTATDLSRVRTLAIGEAIVALVAGCVGGYLLLRRLLRRIGRITTTAADIGSGALDTRLRDPGDGDEVGVLARTFDAMADQLSTTMQAQRRLLSDVSHQLRTPLTVARGHLEVLTRTNTSDPVEVQETAALVLDEIDLMKALVERLLMLGRAMEPDFLDVQPVDLRTFCFDVFDAARVLASRRWVLHDVPDVVVDVDANKVRGALLNLFDNAVRATDVDDAIALTVEVRPEGAVLAVEDSGPGIPADRRTVTLERFSRPGAADSEGSGLGLAIVRAVAEAHGGSVVIDDSPLGGARVAMTLPVLAVAVEPVDLADEPASCAS
jgi:two-component system, OmpR family, sensor kinase